MPVPVMLPRIARSSPRLAAMRLAAMLLAVALTAPAVTLPAAAAPPGFAFLEIPTGARSAAMGGALSSVASGAEAMYANPATIEPAKGMEVAAGHSELVQSLRHDYFSVAGHAWGGGLGASIRALYSEPIEERDDVGNLIGTFGAHDLEFALGYAARMGNALRLGATMQAVRERIANESAATYGFGLGGSWEPARWQGLRLGLTAQNLGPPAHYTIDGSRGLAVGLPQALQGGASYAMNLGARMNLRGAVETRVTRGRSGIGIVGAELTDASGAVLRGGLRVNDDASNFSLGAGFTTGGLRLDYAFVPFKLDLGDTHRVSFTARF